MRPSYFKTNLRELRFTLFEHLDVGSLAHHEDFEEFTPDVLEMALGEAEKIAREVISAANPEADQIGARFVDGRVVMPPKMK